MTDLTVAAASKMKVSELKEQLTLHGLDTSGLKADLMARLTDFINSPPKKAASSPKKAPASPQVKAAASPVVKAASPVVKAASPVVKVASPVVKAASPKAKAAQKAPEADDMAVDLAGGDDDMLAGDDEVEVAPKAAVAAKKSPAMKPASPAAKPAEKPAAKPAAPEKHAAPAKASLSAVDRVITLGGRLGEGNNKRGREEPEGGRDFKRPKQDGVAGGAGGAAKTVEPKKEAPAVAEASWTNTLSISNFIRPFTLVQLKDMLSASGTVEDLWLNTIKSHCFVRFASPAEAEKCRHATYDLNWPLVGSRRLHPEFSTQAKMEEMKGGVVPSPRELKDTRITIGVTAGASVTPRGAAAIDRTMPSPRVEAEPAKVVRLEDLFRKTAAKPPIYYLPLTAEEVAAKKKGTASTA